ncbi:MAG TPA: ankyrin repeat domain-containing protein [Chryseolinea sp.]|nr:ankyrin repeat domain-containing protein [Chryseolinea sp.]
MNEIAELIKARNNVLLAEKLESNPALAHAKTEQGISLLQFAAYYRNREAIDIIRQYKVDLDIFEAATVGDEQTLLRKLQEPPDLVNAYSRDGFTLLGLASYFAHPDVVKVLLQYDADTNIASNNQFRVAPLHSACASSNYDIAEMLLRAGADVNAKQMSGVTPLHSAAHNGQTKLAKLLIDHGADVNAMTENGQTPLAMAKEKGFSETVELMKRLGGE